MDPLHSLHSLQDVVLCTCCQTSAVTMYCKTCYEHLCKNCDEKHSSDSFKVHQVGPLKQYSTTLNYPRCRKHPTKRCKVHCKECDIPICEKCISSKKHLRDIQVEILKQIESEKEVLQGDLREIQEYIYPKYKEVASNIPKQKAHLSKKSQKLITAINK